MPGVRLGNWLTATEARTLGQFPDAQTLKGKRDRALLAILLGCGLRRRELIELDYGRIQRRDEQWAIVHPASLAEGSCSASVRRAPLGATVSAKKLFGRLSNNTPENRETSSSLRTIYDAGVPVCAVLLEERWNRSNSCSGTFRFKQRRDTSDVNDEFERP